MLALACLASLTAAITAGAQEAPISVPGDLHDGTPRATGDSITFCIDDRLPEWTVHRAVGELVAASLLVEPKFYLLKESLTERSDQFEGVPEALLFILLDDECEAFLGMPITERIVYPGFVTVTRPYVAAGFVLASTSGAASLGTLLEKGGRRVGVSASGPVFPSLSYYYPESISRVYRSSELLLAAVRAGEAEAGIFWEPEFLALTGGDLGEDGLTIGSIAPLAMGEWSIGAIMLSRETYLRTMLDEAVASLLADGSLAALLTEFGLRPPA